MGIVVRELVRCLSGRVGNNPLGLAFDGANMWVANQGSNNVMKLHFDPAADITILGTFAVGTSPAYLAFDGANMWVTNNGSNTVTKLSLSGEVLGTFAVGTQPLGIAFDGANMWVAKSWQQQRDRAELEPGGSRHL
jgi:DNA-binding beta-propeller fold protein YncE